MEFANAIQILKTASGQLLTQKYVAIYKELGYDDNAPNGTLDSLGVDTNQILGGAFSEVSEVLTGGKFSESSGLGFASGVASFLLTTEVLSATVKESSKIMEHPLEIDVSNGNQRAQNYIADHSIVLPNEVSIRMAFPSMLYQSVYKEARDLFRQKTMLVVMTKANTYRRMVLTNFSHTEEPSTITRINFDFTFREIQGQYPVTNKSKDPQNASL